jgi:hypothetical protein
VEVWAPVGANSHPNRHPKSSTMDGMCAGGGRWSNHGPSELTGLHGRLALSRETNAWEATGCRAFDVRRAPQGHHPGCGHKPRPSAGGATNPCRYEPALTVTERRQSNAHG